jgi:hypothetical protein
MMSEIQNIDFMSDKDLYRLCKKYGYITLEARQKFIGLLPEVYRRRLFEKKGYGSIYEFAGKLAGISKAQVNLTLSLEKRFEDKPILRRALVDGQMSINKLSRLTSIATTENEQELFARTKLLSNRAVEVFVRDVKYFEKARCTEETYVVGGEGAKGCDVGGVCCEQLGGNNINATGESGKKVLHVQKLAERNSEMSEVGNFCCEGFVKKNIDAKGESARKSLHVQKLVGEEVRLDADVKEKLLRLQKQGIDVNQFLRDALEKRKEDIEKKKSEIVREQIGRQSSKRKASRYLSVKVRQVLKDEFGTKCSISSCYKPAKVVHHTQRFSLRPVHDPRFLAPLCEEHHEIAHKIDVKFVEVGGGG